MQYVIFPGQFAYLYSYHPTGNMGDIPSILEEKWKEQHKKDASAAFARVEKEGQQVAGPSFFQAAKDTATALQAKASDDN